MADNYLITGYWGEPHVTAENDRGIHAAIFGAGRFVLPVGEQFKAEYIGNNTIRVYDGKLVDNGAAAGIPAGEYVDLLISNAGQGMKRNDLIVFQYEQDASTLVESGRFVVVQGAESSGTAADPELTQQDLLSGDATFDQMALWRVSISGATIAAPVQVFELANSLETAPSEGTWTPTVNGGTIKTAIGHYTKTGKHVVISFYINGVTGAGTTALYMTIGNLPFVADNTAKWYGGGGHMQGLNMASGVFTGFVLDSVAQSIYSRTSNGGYAQINNNSAEYYVSGTIAYVAK